MIEVEYQVVEHYGTEAPEPFGVARLPAAAPPRVGDVIMLRWLDGRDAYRVRVETISGTTLHVRSVPA